MSQDPGSSDEVLSRIKQLELEVAKQSKAIKQLQEEVEGPIALVRPIDGTRACSDTARAVGTTVPPPASGNNISASTASHTDSESTRQPFTDTSLLTSGSSSARGVNTAASILQRAKLSQSLVSLIRKTEAKVSLDEVRKLISEGADLAFRDPETGFSALNRAAHFGNVELLVLLLDSGAPLEIRDDGGNTPLHYGATRGHLQVVQLLLGAGANVDATNKDGGTPLMLAAYLGHIKCVRALIDGGANTLLKKKNGSMAKDLTKDEKIKKILS